MRQRDWIGNIYKSITETSMIYEGKSIIIEMSEPLRDLIINQLSTETHMSISENSCFMNDDKIYLNGCLVVVSNQIPTYRIFVEV